MTDEDAVRSLLHEHKVPLIILHRSTEQEAKYCSKLQKNPVFTVGEENTTEHILGADLVRESIYHWCIEYYRVCTVGACRKMQCESLCV